MWVRELWGRDPLHQERREVPFDVSYDLVEVRPSP